jgi:hypothetical protein
METRIYTAYATDEDMVFIMRDVWEDGEFKYTECIGWYYAYEEGVDIEDRIGRFRY